MKAGIFLSRGYPGFAARACEAHASQASSCQPHTLYSQVSTSAAVSNVPRCANKGVLIRLKNKASVIMNYTCVIPIRYTRIILKYD